MRYWVMALAFVAASPAAADSRFRITVMPRPDLAPGKGQCDIRLSIDNEVQVTIRRDQVLIHTLSGQEALDDGSDCNSPFPDREVRNFVVQSLDNRSEMRILEQPSARNDYALVLRVQDVATGFGRYHFRLTWDSASSPVPESAPNPPPPAPAARKGLNDSEHPNAPQGFAWNNAVTYRGRGSGESFFNGRPQRLAEVRVDVDLAGKIVVTFMGERGPRGFARQTFFTGTVMNREGMRIRADMVSEDHRLHGTMTLSVDDSHNVNSVSMNATDGQDHLRVTWDRK